MISIQASSSPLQEKSQALAKQVAEVIQKTFGDLEPVDELGIHLTFKRGLKPSTISLDLLTKDGQMQQIRFSSTGTVADVSWSGGQMLPLICEALEELRGSDNEK